MHMHMLHSLCHSNPSNHLLQIYIIIINIVICIFTLNTFGGLNHKFVLAITSYIESAIITLQLLCHCILHRCQSDLSSVALISSKLYCHNCKYPGMSYSSKPLALTAYEIQCVIETNVLVITSQELKSCNHQCVSCSLSYFSYTINYFISEVTNIVLLSYLLFINHVVPLMNIKS